MHRVVHFELLSREPARTAAFYAAVFGWRAVRGEGDYWRLITGEDGADGHGAGGSRPSDGAPSEVGSDGTGGGRGAVPAAGGRSGRGINGATVRPVNDALPYQTVNTVQVPDVDAAAAKAVAHGGRTLSDVIALPGVGRFRYCADPDGIPFGLIEYDGDK